MNEIQKTISEKNELRKASIVNNFLNAKEVLPEPPYKSTEELFKAFPEKEHFFFTTEKLNSYIDEIKKSEDEEVLSKAVEEVGSLQMKSVVVEGKVQSIFVGLKKDLVVKAKEEEVEEETEEGTEE